MGLIERIFSLVFGSDRNVLRDTVEVFRPNAEAQAQRDFDLRGAALDQFAREFQLPRQGWFDRFMDGVNRLPRPAMALGTLGLFVAAMVDPDWFGARMVGLALVPEPLWWLLGAIVSFYFGARHQAKGQEFQRDLAARMAEKAPKQVPEPKVNHRDPVPHSSIEQSDNPALDEWRKTRPQP